MSTFEQVKEFWDGMPETTPDHFYGELEIREISKHLQDGVSILDVGCGDGSATVRFADQFPRSTFVGMDYSKAMIETARKRECERKSHVAYSYSNAMFYVGDVRVSINEQYDIIISKRCLINLPTWEIQRAALLNLYFALRPNGKLILVENTAEGLDKLNELRFVFGLPAIPMRWHNQYFRLGNLLPFLHQTFEVVGQQNIGNLYYIASRVINAGMAVIENREPSYDDPINELAYKLPIMDGPYSPNMLWVLRKR